ncbi:MAG: hypothetical protein ABSB59_39600 [Streptosporangiaceae bacterium]
MVAGARPRLLDGLWPEYNHHDNHTGRLITSLTAQPRRGTIYAAKAIVLTSLTLITSFIAFFVGQALLSGHGVSASLFHSVTIPLNANVSCPQGPGPGGGGRGLPPGCKVVFSGVDVISPSTVLMAIIGCALSRSASATRKPWFSDMAADPVLPDGVAVREVTAEADLSEIAAMESEVWAEDWSWLADDLITRIASAPADTAVFAVSDEAGLWGGSTLAAWRRRGIYRALVAIRAQRAAARGVRYLEVDASEASAPILRQLGFRAATTPYVWAPPNL